MPITGLIVLLSAAACGGNRSDPLDDCVQHGRLGMHIHATLSMAVDGEPLKIPANIGVTSGCLRPLHTHDESGTIHIEHPRQVDFTLGDFLRVGEAGGFDPVAGNQVSLVFVDGAPYQGDYQTVPLADGGTIRLEIVSR